MLNFSDGGNCCVEDTFVPVAEFIPTDSTICVNECIGFSDLSTYEKRSQEMSPGAPLLRTPDLRVAATVVAVSRTKATAQTRGVWP